MKPKKIPDPVDAAPHGGKTRPRSEAIDETVAAAFRDVQPKGFKDHPNSAIDASESDPDVQDTIGAE